MHAAVYMRAASLFWTPFTSIGVIYSWHFATSWKYKKIKRERAHLSHNYMYIFFIFRNFIFFVFDLKVGVMLFFFIKQNLHYFSAPYTWLLQARSTTSETLNYYTCRCWNFLRRIIAHDTRVQKSVSVRSSARVYARGIISPRESHRAIK